MQRADPTDDPSVHTSYAIWWPRFGVPALAAVAAALSAWSFRGPYRWIAELAYDRLDGYDSKFVFVATVFLLLLPGYLLLLVARVVGAIRGIPEPVGSDAKRAEERTNAWWSIHQRWFAFAVFPGTFFVLSSYELWAANAEPVQEIALDGSRPISVRMGSGVSFHGRALVDDSVRLYEYGPVTYVPIVATTGSPIYRVFLRASSDTELATLSDLEGIEGTVRGSLPGIAQIVFERRGRRLEGDLVVTLGTPDSSDLASTRSRASFSAAGLALVLVAYAFRRRSLRAEIARRYDAIERSFETTSPPSSAGTPAEMRVSRTKLRRLRPALFAYDDAGSLERIWLRATFARREASFLRTHLDGVLRGGDCRAAVVIERRSTRVLVAAYSDELDASIVLRFPYELAVREGWNEGDHLLAVFAYGEGPVAEDLIEGPHASGRWGECIAFLAELYVDDAAEIARRKATIADGEWERAAALGREAVQRNRERSAPFRDGLHAAGLPWSA